MVDFAAHAGPFIDAGIAPIAASVDSVADTATLRVGLHVGFPMYAEVDAHAFSDATGGFIQTGDRTFIHATGFLLNPDGKVATAAYATGPVGRITASEVLRVVRFLSNR